MSLLKRKRVLAAAVETTAGTAESLSGTDGAFNVYNLMIQPNISVETREAQGAFNYLPAVPGARLGTATFRTDIGYDGTNVPSWASVLLPACGWVNSSGTFYPTTEAPGSNVKTITIAAFIDGMKKQIYGAMGSWRAICPNGRMCSIEWTFTGLWSAPVDAGIISPTYPASETAIRYASATTEFNSTALCVENITFDAGNTIKMIECASTAAGFKHAIVTNRAPRATANPEGVLVATDDRYGDWLAATEAELSVELDGPSTSTVTITAPKSQIINAQEGDREGLVIDDIEWACNKNSTTNDQELSITFTASV